MTPAIHFLRLLRPAQWTKNLFVLAALVFAFGDRAQNLPPCALASALGAMLCFCAVSSGVYIFNDLRDAELDRAHPTKRFRPIAAGQVSRAVAVVSGLLLLGAGLGGAAVIRRELLLVIATYLVIQFFYTGWLKRIGLVDVFIIATGFVLRALAGAVAIPVTISPWLLLCTFLIALFLALCKRRHELLAVEDAAANTRPSLGRYDARVLDNLISMSAGATLVSYAIYTLWPETIAKFETTHLGFTIPFVAFGLFRYMDLAYRLEVGGQPERVLLDDRPLLVTIALYAATVMAVLLGGL